MPTFLALRCYKCNMMQVKHDKKSSNKWSCSVCNEKQSVQKVFATSTAAKDIRKFVQDYNLTCNITQDRVLAELVQKADNGCNAGFMCDDAPSFNIFCDEFSQPHVKTENKWTEYLSPQNEGLYAETAGGGLDDAKFVTTIPEKIGRMPKGRVRAAVEKQDEEFPLQQQEQVLSFTRGRNGNFLNKSIKSFAECHDDMQKENDLPSLWARKTSSGSSLQVQKNASIHHRKQLVGFKIPQETVADVSLHRRKGTGPNGERVLVQANFDNKSNAASKMPEISRGMKEKPVSKWATYLDLTEDVRDQSTRRISEQDKHVSKWAKYVDFDEVKPRVEAMQNCGQAAKWGKFLEASEVVFPKPGQSQESSSIWSLKAASNLQCLNSLVKTELDELLNTPCISEEVEDEVHPLFL